MFKLFSKKKKITTPLNFTSESIDKSTVKTNENDLSAEYLKNKFSTEMLTPMPTIMITPPSWCRPYLVGRVMDNIKSQATRVISVFIILVVLSSCLAFASFSLFELSKKQITDSLADTKNALGMYSSEIKSAMKLNGILKFVHSVPVELQARGVIKVMVESGVVSHGIKFNHIASEIPDNVKNNFETASSVKFDEVKIVGIWYIDGTFINVAPDSQPANEDWLLDVNQKFKKLYSETGVNVYMDISSRRISTRDNQNRNEFVIVFWKLS